jgi:hypothetical protein
VPKYDAFGREIGEDTLSGLGGEEQAAKRSDWEARIAEARAAQEAQQESERAVPEPEPVVFTGAPQVPVEPPPPRPTPPPQRPAVSIPTGIPSTPKPRRVRRGRRGFGCLFSLVFLGVILVGPIIAIVSFVGDTSDSVRRAIDDATKGLPNSQDNAPPPQGLGGRSMIRAQNLGPALNKIRTTTPGKVGMLVIRADRIDATLVSRRTRTSQVSLDYKGTMNSTQTQSAGVAQDTVAWDAIDPNVPQRLARAGAGKAGANDINYVIARPPTVFQTGKVAWYAYYNSGRIIEADAGGKPVRRIS